MADSSSETGASRLDRWLWAVRVFKTRPLATDACRRDRVKVNDLPAKAAREVHDGEIVTVRHETFTRTLRVVGVPRSRVGAKALSEFCLDLTPPAELEQQRRARVPVAPREPGSGRPTKRDRRRIDRLLGYSG